jgi:hypothetical protein
LSRLLGLVQRPKIIVERWQNIVPEELNVFVRRAWRLAGQLIARQLQYYVR